MITNNYNDDHRLDILVLGPMDMHDDQNASSVLIGDAIELILKEDTTQKILEQTRIIDHSIHIPERWEEPEIIEGVFSRLDIADLVVINITPKDGAAGTPSPNVYYELGLVHALGLPFIVVAEQGTKAPFYATGIRIIHVASFTLELLVKALRLPIQHFLDPGDHTNFTSNRLTQFYEGLPVVDISAAIGLATGYYYNFVGRLLREGSFVSTHPDKVKRLIVVRPTNVLETYEQDKKLLSDTLSKEGFKLVTEKLDAPAGDGKGPAWIDHVDGIVIDLPRTIYPLKISPRLLAMQGRLDKPGYSSINERERTILLRQTSERLLDRVEHAIRYHVRKEREGYRSSLLHFARIEEVVGLLRRFG